MTNVRSIEREINKATAMLMLFSRSKACIDSMTNFKLSFKRQDNRELRLNITLLSIFLSLSMNHFFPSSKLALMICFLSSFFYSTRSKSFFNAFFWRNREKSSRLDDRKGRGTTRPACYRFACSESGPSDRWSTILRRLSSRAHVTEIRDLLKYEWWW